jgi:hypothetical protein
MDYIELHQASIHMIDPDPGHEWNEVNPGAGIVYRGYAGGWYLNSVGRDSYYLAKRFQLSRIFAADVGLVTGYAYPVVPLAALQARFGLISVRIMPAVTQRAVGAVFGFSLILPF